MQCQKVLLSVSSGSGRLSSSILWYSEQWSCWPKGKHEYNGRLSCGGLLFGKWLALLPCPLLASFFSFQYFFSSSFFSTFFIPFPPLSASSSRKKRNLVTKDTPHLPTFLRARFTRLTRHFFDRGAEKGSPTYLFPFLIIGVICYVYRWACSLVKDGCRLGLVFLNSSSHVQRQPRVLLNAGYCGPFNWLRLHHLCQKTMARVKLRVVAAVVGSGWKPLYGNMKWEKGMHAGKGEGQGD